MTETPEGRAKRQMEHDTRTTSYPPDAILTEEEVAAWLLVSPKTVSRYPIKRAQLGGRTRRYIAEDVYTFIRSRAA
jgi:hypothetical protein